MRRIIPIFLSLYAAAVHTSAAASNLTCADYDIIYHTTYTPVESKDGSQACIGPDALPFVAGTIDERQKCPVSGGMKQLAVRNAAGDVHCFPSDIARGLIGLKPLSEQ